MNYYENIFPARPFLKDFDPERLDKAAFVIDMQALERNLQILDTVQNRCGAKVLLALKGFANYAAFPLVSRYLKGCCASSPHEARLAREEFGGEVHSYAPAYSDADIDLQLKYSDHIVFNSFSQLEKHRQKVFGKCEIGLRVNPLHSETEVDLYNPCAPGSRLGIHPQEFTAEKMKGVDGLHFHTLCQKNSDALARTAAAFEEHFGQYLSDLKWINFGGGHHITQPDYDIELLCRTVSHFREKYNVEVYLEPGEAVGINTGSLICTVLEVVEGQEKTAILDISITCHMPDVLEMPYRPEVRGAGKKAEKEFSYRLGGLSCLAGDVISDYSFDCRLNPGDKLIFDDMTHYTTVKTTTFNGINHPDIILFFPEEDRLEKVREFSYEDYRNRL